MCGQNKAYSAAKAFIAAGLEAALKQRDEQVVSHAAFIANLPKTDPLGNDTDARAIAFATSQITLEQAKTALTIETAKFIENGLYDTVYYYDRATFNATVVALNDAKAAYKAAEEAFGQYLDELQQLQEADLAVTQ